MPMTVGRSGFVVTGNSLRRISGEWGYDQEQEQRRQQKPMRGFFASLRMTAKNKQRPRQVQVQVQVPRQLQRRMQVSALRVTTTKASRSGRDDKGVGEWEILGARLLG